MASPSSDPERGSALYEIVVEGRVVGALTRALEGFEVVPGPTDQTCFRGRIRDKAALQAALRRVSACHLTLAGVRRLEEPTAGGT